jgi:hypothetical protein
LRMWPVSKRVNKVGNGDDPSLIEPVALGSAASGLLSTSLWAN